MAQIPPMRIEDLARFGIVFVGADALQCAVGDLATADAVFGAADQFENPRDRLIQRTRGDQAHQVWNLDGVIVAMGGLVGDAERGEVGRCGSVSHIASIAASFIFWCSLAA